MKYEQQKEVFFSSLFFFLSWLFMNVHFIKKKLKETKNPEGYQDKVLEKETVSEAPVIISP